jgi:hypothetical protein
VSFSVTVVLGSVMAARVVSALGWGRAAAVGLTSIALGSGLFVGSPTILGIAAGAALSGLGLGIAAVACTDLGTHDGSTGASAAGVLNTGAQLGTALGTAVILLVVELASARVAWASVAGLSLVAAATIGHWAPGRRRATLAPVGRRTG